MNGGNESQKESPFACNMMALDAEQRKRHEVLVHSLRVWQSEIREFRMGTPFGFQTRQV